ncbi:MAG: hypothetical protein ACE15F_23650 [bacterium]
MIIKKKIILIQLLFLSFNNLLFSQTQLIETIVPPVPNKVTLDGGETPEIYWLNCGNNFLEINYIAFTQWWGDNFNPDPVCNIDWSILVQYDIYQKIFGNPILRWDLQSRIFVIEKWNQWNGLVHDASSVEINGQKIFLENAYWTNYEEINDVDENEQLVEACLSPEKQYIIGITKYTGSAQQHFSSFSLKMHFWNSKTGAEMVEMRHQIGADYYEIYFSPKGKYLLCRYPFPPFYPNDIIYLDEEIWVRGPKTLLIDLSHLRKLISNRDVAFTSDDEYFVTERDGVPTLVHARTDTNILRYAMESPMISAAFSPDNQRLYIAGANSKIYVFDSHLPSRAAGWELFQ